MSDIDTVSTGERFRRKKDQREFIVKSVGAALSGEPAVYITSVNRNGRQGWGRDWTKKSGRLITIRGLLLKFTREKP